MSADLRPLIRRGGDKPRRPTGNDEAMIQHTNRLNRRTLLQGFAAGALTLHGLCGRVLASDSAAAGLPPGSPRMPHFPARAKRVIFLFMHGGPSHVDTFDYKPRLQKDDGKEYPGELPANISAKPKLLGSPWKFARHGNSGLWVSELLPETAKLVDDLCVIRSVHSKGQSHGQAVCMVHTGSDSLPRPSVGAWVSYGLGSENSDLPAFVSIGAPTAHGGPRNYGSAFLPAMHQATTIGRAGNLGNASIAYLDPAGRSPQAQTEQLALLQGMNRDHATRLGGDARIEGAIQSFDLAYRMQSVAPAVMDLAGETPETQRLYGIDETATANFGRQCLLARRMAEAGVRYIQVSTGNVWDQHGGLKSGHEKNSLATDKPVAGLLADLKRRGMLDETLVVWGGEFGRTPIVQGKDGRDHNPQGFTMWMAGGGVRGGFAHGNTDEFGYHAVEDRVHMHDLHATLLHALGLNHERLTYQHAGRNFRLTDVAGRVVTELFA